MLLFLSHAGEESAAAQAIARELRRAGVEVWLDTETLKPGDRWMEQIEAALGQADAFGVYIGASGIRRWVDREVRAALQRQTADSRFRIIPILGPGADPDALPPFLAQHAWLDLRKGVELERVRSLVAGILGRPAADVTLVPEGEPPYRGLEHFDVEHAHLFFGRDGDIDALLAGLRRDAFLAVVGSSGSGKSSVVRAGLIPALERGRFHDGLRWCRDWRIGIARPGAQPFRELATVLAELARGLPYDERLAVRAECERQLREGTGGLSSCVASLVPTGARTLIVIDQFEEIFTLVTDADQRARFVSSLVTAADLDSGRPVHVVITLRADFYSQCWEHTDLLHRIAHNQHALGPLDRAALRAVIEKPLLLAGVRMEAGLVEAILTDVGDEPGNLPLLEHSLLRLWDRRAGDLLTHHAYQAIGRAQGAIARYADQVYGALDEPHRALARKIVLRLVRPGEGTSHTRRRVRKLELLALGDEPGEVEKVLGKLLRARLLTTWRTADDAGDLIDIAHEALIRGWPLLREWVDANRDALRIAGRLSDAAAEWESLARDAGALYRGARLAEAEEWARREWEDLTPGEQEFLEASVAARDREATEREERRRRELELARNLATEADARAQAEVLAKTEAERRAAEAQLAERRQRRVSRWLAAASVIALVFATLSMVQRNRALTRQRVAESREFAAMASREADVEPVRSLVFAIEAARRANTYEAQEALRRALLAPQQRLILYHTSSVALVEFSPDGRRVLALAGNRTGISFDQDRGADLAPLTGVAPNIIVWDVESGDTVAAVGAHIGGVLHASFGPESRTVVTVGSDGVGRVWDIATGALVSTLEGHTGPIVRAAYSPDGRSIATASTDSTARVWDAATGAEVARLAGHESLLRHVAYSPRGGQIVTASNDGTARIWKVDSAAEPTLLAGHEAEVVHATFSPDGSMVVTSSYDRTARLWDATTGELLHRIEHDAPLLATRFNTEGTQLVVTALGKAFLWSIRNPRQQSPRERVELRYPESGQVTVHAEFSPDDGSVLTVGEDGTARHWSAAGGSALGVLRGHLNHVFHATFSPDGRQIATAGLDGTARLWWVGGETPPVRGHTGEIETATLSPDARFVASARERDSVIHLWEAATGKRIAEFRGHTAEVRDIIFRGDGDVLASVGRDRSVRVWEVATERQLQQLSHPNVVLHAAFDATGSRLVTAAADGPARIWDVATGTELTVLRGHEPFAGEATFSADGQRVVTAGRDGTARVWNAETGEQLILLEAQDSLVAFAQFTTDGKKVVTGTEDGTVTVWDASTGAETAVLRGHAATVWHVLFVDEANRIITSSWDGTARLWDLSSGRELAVLQDHTDGIYRAVPSPDRRRVATIGFDAPRLWDARTGRLLSTLHGHRGAIRDLAFVDGDHIRTVAEDGTSRTWFVNASDLLELAESHLPIDLTPESRRSLIAQISASR